MVGRGVVPALVAGGHQVEALAHRPETRQLLQKLGATVVDGDMNDTALLATRARAADAVVHMAQMTPPGRVSKKAIDVIGRADVEATRSLLGALEGTNKPFIYTSGAWVYGPVAASSGAARDEAAPARPYPLIEYKLEGERLTLEAAKKGVASSVVRPGTVYGPWGLFEQYLLKPNKEKGKASVLGSGAQRTSYLHVEDCGEMYRALLEKPRPGEVWNLCDNEPVPVRTMADEVARLMNAKPPGKVPGFVIKLAMGLLGPPLLGDNPVDGKKFLNAYGYRLRYPTYREGAKAVVDAWTRGG